MMIDKYNMEDFLNNQSKIMKKKIDNLDIENDSKKQIMSSYKTYLKSYISDLNSYYDNASIMLKILNNINDAFINKILLIPKDKSEIKVYINYIKKNINNINPLSLNDSERNAVFLISTNNFDILNESIAHKTESYLSLFHTLRRLAIRLGYGNKKNEYKPNLAFSDENVPDAIKDAINGVEK